MSIIVVGPEPSAVETEQELDYSMQQDTCSGVVVVAREAKRARPDDADVQLGCRIMLCGVAG